MKLEMMLVTVFYLEFILAIAVGDFILAQHWEKRTQIFANDDGVE